MNYPEGSWEQQVKDGFKLLTGYSGVTVIYTDKAGIEYRPRVLYSEPTLSVLGGMQQSDDYAIEYDPADLPGLKYNSRLIIKGATFSVREASKTDDGYTYRATLTKGDPV